MKCPFKIYKRVASGRAQLINHLHLIRYMLMQQLGYRVQLHPIRTHAVVLARLCATNKNNGLHYHRVRLAYAYPTNHTITLQPLTFLAQPLPRVRCVTNCVLFNSPLLSHFHYKCILLNIPNIVLLFGKPSLICYQLLYLPFLTDARHLLTKGHAMEYCIPQHPLYQ